MRPFEALDLEEMNGWYTARGLPTIPFAKLPETGRIQPGVAAGFLYLTDSDMALLDGFVTNPRATIRQRSRAIDEITAALLWEAKLRGVSQVVGFCRARGIERRVRKSFGMRTIGTYAVVAREV